MLAAAGSYREGDAGRGPAATTYRPRLTSEVRDAVEVGLISKQLGEKLMIAAARQSARQLERDNEVESEQEPRQPGEKQKPEEELPQTFTLEKVRYKLCSAKWSYLTDSVVWDFVNKSNWQLCDRTRPLITRPGAPTARGLGRAR